MRIFLSYAHEDGAKWLQRLRIHLDALHHVENIAIFDDRKLLVGTAWNTSIKQELDDANIIILILTPGFCGSDYCKTVELEIAMKRQGRGLATVVPILAEHCAWDTLPPLTALQLVPVDDKRKVKPLSKWGDRSQALDTIRRQIQEIIDGAEKPQQGLHDIASVPTLTSAYGADDFRKLLDRAYLIDREPQSADMAAALEESFNDSAKLPIIGIAAGTADHRHELLVDLFAKESFQVRSARAPIELGAFARRVIPAIDFPFGEALPDHDCQSFVRRVAGKLHAKSHSTSDIREAMNALRQPCAFASTIYAEHYDSEHKRLLELWLDFWHELGSESLSHSICLLLCIEETSSSAISGQTGRVRKRPIADATRIIRDVNEMAHNKRIRLRVLRKFTDINRRMVFDWLGCERLAAYCPDVREQREHILQRIMLKAGADALPLDRLCKSMAELAG